MPRKLRIQYQGAIYHVINRGDRREDIFLDDTDRSLFLGTLGQACEKTGWQVHAYCLMRNHFHLVVETPKANLVPGMQWLLGTYTTRFNRKHRLSGHLFSGRYKCQLVDGSGNGYLRTVCDYVHLNPTRAKLLGPRTKLSNYRWSSYPLYLKAQRPKWLRVDRVLGECGIPKDIRAGRRHFEARMEQRSREESHCPDQWKPLREAWSFGDADFRQELLDMIAHKSHDHHYGEEVCESAEALAGRIVQTMLKAAGWSQHHLRSRRKGDPLKVRIATRLRAETTMPWKWIAQKLGMGHWRSAANAVRLRTNGK